MQYRSTLQRINLTLHCKYPAKNLWDQCKFVSDEVKKTTGSTKQLRDTLEQNSPLQE